MARQRWKNLTQRQVGIYNNWDCYATARLYGVLRDEMQRRGRPDYYTREVWPAVHAVIGMQRRGLAVDTFERDRVRNSLEMELASTEATIRDAAGDINLNSPPQRARFLFETLGLKRVKRTETGKDSTDLEVLFRILRYLRKKDEHARPVLEAMFHRSRLNTLLTRYLSFRVLDGRVYPRIKFCGTKTERLAYSEPAMQQFPEEIRSMVIAAPGCVLISADYSQLEARILAVLSDDKASLASFAAGEDIHTSNARDLFQDWDTMNDTQRKAARNFAKTFLYGISYGGAAETIKTRLFCPCPRCADKAPPTLELSRLDMQLVAQRWFARHSALTRFRRELEQQIRRFRYWDSPFGGRRFVFAPWSTAQREIYNYPMQNCAARIVNRAMVKLHQHGAPIVLQMHDSLMLEVQARAVDSWKSLLIEIMQATVPELGTSFPVKVSAAERWSEL